VTANGCEVAAVAREPTVTVKNKVQLIVYPDSLGGNLETLDTILQTQFPGLFGGGLHILPPYPSSADRGFSPLTHLEIDPAFGTWSDLQRIGRKFDVTLDVVVNHISRRSIYFQDFVRRGRSSEYSDLFITLDKIWPNGTPPETDVAKIHLRRPGRPFSKIVVAETGQEEWVWTSFGAEDESEQIDLDVNSAPARSLLAGILTHLSRHHIKLVRLDAVGYVVKKAGSSCFFVEPEIYAFLDWIRDVASQVGLELLPEVHATAPVQARLAARGFYVYDFVLPLLILYTLHSGSSHKLSDYLRTCPRHQFTMLDCHDGIPVQPDLNGILTIEESQTVVAAIVQRGANLNRIHSERDQKYRHFDVHQINCTYFSALGCSPDAYLTARAIQFFTPGVPQVYYVGLLAGENDLAAVQRTGEGRAINRHNYSVEEIGQALRTHVVQRLIRLIEFRNAYGAFDGEFAVSETDDRTLRLSWQKSEMRCSLSVDLLLRQSVIEYIDTDGAVRTYTP
jgi:sucrose 6(F)-phosphate phosphorylase